MIGVNRTDPADGKLHRAGKHKGTRPGTDRNELTGVGTGFDSRIIDRRGSKGVLDIEQEILYPGIGGGVAPENGNSGIKRPAGAVIDGDDP